MKNQYTSFLLPVTGFRGENSVTKMSNGRTTDASGRATNALRFPTVFVSVDETRNRGPFARVDSRGL
jgi:hypothetical protein